ncbi:zinc finger, CCHC-type containing protein [Tanacetum coccineum]|uniref:Zinc finger, CCHC-type containing protein n=1 Tax=Tanacetum coccineum TaxID=301880 RepID=A0ABQ5IEJ8_9ASTR
MFPVLSRMAMDIISVQATSVASESVFSTSGRVLSIRRTRLTPASLEMCMCLKDHLDAQKRKQHKSGLKNPIDFEEEILDAEVQQNEAIPLSEEEIALDVASSEGTMSGSGSGGEEERHASGHVFHPGPVWGCDRLVSRAKVIENQVMAILVISVSSDSSEDSVGIPAGRVILFGTIPTTIPDTTPVITPPTTQTDTTMIPTEIPIIAPNIPPSPDYTPTSPDYSPTSDSKSDPYEDPSLDHIPPLPATSPFLSSADDTTDNDTPNTPPSPTHDHSSLELPSTSAGPSRKRRWSPMASVPALPPVARALSPVRADLIPSPKRIRSLELATDLEGYSKDSFEPYVPRERRDGMDIDHVEAVIEACFDFADIIRTSGVDVRVEAVTVARDDVKTGTIDPIVVSGDRDTPPVVPEVIPEPAQEGAAGGTYETLGSLVQRFHDHTQAIPVHRIQVIEGVQREQGHKIVRVKSTVTALTERVAELERDNRRLRGTTSVESQRVDRL